MEPPGQALNAMTVHRPLAARGGLQPRLHQRDASAGIAQALLACLRQALGQERLASRVLGQHLGGARQAHGRLVQALVEPIQTLPDAMRTAGRPVSASSSPAMRFIAGEPMNSATNRLTGLS